MHYVFFSISRNIFAIGCCIFIENKILLKKFLLIFFINLFIFFALYFNGFQGFHRGKYKANDDY